MDTNVVGIDSGGDRFNFNYDEQSFDDLKNNHPNTAADNAVPLNMY